MTDTKLRTDITALVVATLQRELLRKADATGYLNAVWAIEGERFQKGLRDLLEGAPHV